MDRVTRFDIFLAGGIFGDIDLGTCVFDGTRSGERVSRNRGGVRWLIPVDVEITWAECDRGGALCGCGTVFEVMAVEDSEVTTHRECPCYTYIQTQSRSIVASVTFVYEVYC